MVACAPVTPLNPDSRLVAGQAYGDLFLALQRWRLCIRRGSHDRVYGRAVSLSHAEWT